MNRARFVFETVPAALSGASAIAVSTWRYGFAFVIAIAILFFGAAALPDTAIGLAVFIVLTGGAWFASCVFSAAAYRTRLDTKKSLLMSALQLMLAWFLVIVIAAIVSTFVLLFFSLIGSSLGVVSADSGQDITDMTAQMREGGTFYPLFALFILTLLAVFWFAVRLMLFAAATVAQGSVHVFRTWAWTKGAFLHLALGMLVFVLLPVFAAVYVAHGVLSILPSPDSLALIAVQSASVHAIMLVPVVWLSHGFCALALTEISPISGASD